MRLPLHFALLALLPVAGWTAESDTAYKALRVFGKQQGENLLNGVTELRGRNGVPQPQVWKVVAADSSARGGVTEADIQRGRIITQRTPTARGGAGVPMDLNQLNLDSDGAFTVADQAMQKQAVPFDRVDYTLRSPGSRQAPVWTLELYDRGTKVALVRIAADSGTLLDQQTFVPQRSTREDYSTDRDYVDRQDRGDRPRPDDRYREDRYRDEPYRADGERWSEAGEPFRGVDDFFHRLGKRFERRGRQLKNFFTGDE